MTTTTSERIVLAAPMSYTGSMHRIRLHVVGAHTSWVRWLLLEPAAWTLILGAWIAVSIWYGTWGLCLVPYRMIRRHSRQRHLDQARHQEMLDTINGKH